MSQADYILICSGRGRVRASDKPANQVVAAMECAAAMVCYVNLAHADKVSDAEEEINLISHQQHDMMDALPDVKKSQAKTLCTDMFALLDALEEKMES